MSKRNWKGPLNCVFCGLPKSIDHIFFQCSVARFIWRIIQTALNFNSIPNNVENLFGSWINSFSKTEKSMILFGCGAVIWAIWRSRNDCCFNDSLITDPTNVILLCCFWIDAWTIRQKEREKPMEQGNLRIRKTTSEIFKKAHGWKPVDRRIQ
jgi:hypothetical protein